MTTDNDRRILKYHVPIGGEHTIELSIFGDIVHVGQQQHNATVAFWAMDNPHNTRQTYTFRVFATSEPVPVGWKHLGTVVDRSLLAVWHLFVQGVDCRRLP